MRIKYAEKHGNVVGSVVVCLQWCQNLVGGHSRPRTGPAREGAGPGGGRARTIGAGSSVTPLAGRAVHPDRESEGGERGSGSSDPGLAEHQTTPCRSVSITNIAKLSFSNSPSQIKKKCDSEATLQTAKQKKIM